MITAVLRVEVSPAPSGEGQRCRPLETSRATQDSEQASWRHLYWPSDINNCLQDIGISPRISDWEKGKKTKEELVPQDWSSHGSDNLLVLLAEESRAQTVMGLGGWWVGRHFDRGYLVNRHPPST